MKPVSLPVIRSTVASVINTPDKYAFVVSNHNFSVVASIADNADYIANDSLLNHFEYIIREYQMGSINNIKISLYYTYLHRGLIQASYSETYLNNKYKAWYMGKYQYKNYFKPCVTGGLHDLTVFTAQHNLRVLLANYSSFHTLSQAGNFIRVVSGNRNEKLYYIELNKRDLFNVELYDSDLNIYNLLTTKNHIINMVNNPETYHNWNIANDNGDYITVEDINIEQLPYGICSNDQIFDGNGDLQDIADCVETIDGEYYLQDDCIQFDIGQYKSQWVKNDDDMIVFGYYKNDQEGYFHYHDEFHHINGEYYHESYVYLNRCDECGTTHLTNGDQDYYTSECGEYTFCSDTCMVEHHSYRTDLHGLELREYSDKIIDIYGFGDSADYIKGKKQYIGIELELDVIDYEGDSIQDILDNSCAWIAKQDGSLSSEGFELNSIPMGMSEILDEVDNLILTENLKMYADAPRRNYGLHIHISKRQLTTFEVFKIQELTINIYNRVLIALNDFNASGYATPTRQYTKDKKSIIKTGYCRSVLCNITDDTLEFRYPRATLDTLRLKANIEACKALVYYAMTHNMLECKHENAYKAFALFVCQNKHIYKNLVKYAEQENLLGLWGV